MTPSPTEYFPKSAPLGDQWKVNRIRLLCAICGHAAARHVEDGGCQATFCSCLASRSIVEKVEGLGN